MLLIAPARTSICMRETAQKCYNCVTMPKWAKKTETAC